MPILVLRQCLRLALYLQESQRAIGAQAAVALEAAAAVVPDGVARPEADPLGNGAVLLLRLCKLLLGAERLLGLLRLLDGWRAPGSRAAAYRHRGWSSSVCFDVQSWVVRSEYSRHCAR